MLRYAHTISSSSRRLASRHPMFCDSCTAGPRQFYPLRNNNLANKTKSGSATISTKQNDSTALQIRFDEPFPSRPYVTVSLNTDNANTNTKISVFGIDQTGFKVSIYDTAATTRRIEWIASV